MAVTAEARSLYDHTARPWYDRETGRVECRVCGDPLLQVSGVDVRHLGEHTPHPAPAGADAPAFTAALETAAAALDGLPPYAGDGDRARAVVTALYSRGLLRRRPAALGRTLRSVP